MCGALTKCFFQKKPELRPNAVHVLFRGNALMLFEAANEIVQLAVSKIQGDFRDVFVRGGHFQACLFDAVITQVFHGRLMGGELEKAAEILGGHTDAGGKLPQVCGAFRAGQAVPRG